MSRIYLSMIVKNEAKIIERCLDAAKPFIDGGVILDTGSTDDTIQRILNWAKTNQKAITIGSSEFRNFAQARNEALDLLMDRKDGFDYILFLDAGMELKQTDKREVTDLHLPSGMHYVMEQVCGNVIYSNTRLVCKDIPMKWKGVVHEYLEVPVPPIKLNGVQIICHQDGGNQDGQIERYRDLLIQGLEEEPQNSRYMFYLAQSYFDLRDWRNALHWYRQRIKAGGWDEETWYATFRSAQCGEALAFPKNDVINMYLKAYYLRPQRAETLNALGWYLRETLGCAGIGDIKGIFTKPKDILFVEGGLYANY